MADLATPKFTSLNLSTLFHSKKTKSFTYGFILTFIACTIFLLFNPASYFSSSSPSWLLKNINNLKNSSLHSSNSIISHFFPNSSSLDLLTPHYNQTWVNDGNVDYEALLHCNVYDGKWVRDDFYPIYEHGSCPFLDEGFNCFVNGRPDFGYEGFRWQPNHCNIPRLNGTHMLELLRGKRMVFVGDSINRNMWESLVCILRNSVQNKSNVFEASGRTEFRSKGSYSFIFKDYNCSLEYFLSTFLVQVSEVPGKNESKKETLRLDLVEQSFDRCKDADIFVFNSGHWWTRGRTSGGKGYFQEGSHVFDKLGVTEAYQMALTTWGKWVDSNVDPAKSQVFFKGYSSSHFRGGEWNAGGKCDKETEPFKKETYLLSYPEKMQVLEGVLKSMKVPVFYLNVTRLTDYRKDAHPAIYRALNLSDEERRSPFKYQDCSHWCLPGVPDTWNELVYVQMLIRQYKMQQGQ